MRKRIIAFLLFLTVALQIAGCSGTTVKENQTETKAKEDYVASDSTSDAVLDSETNSLSTPASDSASAPVTDTASVSEFSGSPYVAVHNNVPGFTKDEITTGSYEFYSEMDGLGRCGTAMACVGPDLMPTEERGSIGQVKPTGWHTVKYDIVDGKYLYNRCHLIGYQLTGENANEKNLMTGTRYLNIEGMLPFENMVADYVKETGNHCMYRVTPVYEGDNLLASGVYMEGYSVEDAGAGISFYVFAYNVQPGITIDYATGDSCLAQGAAQPQEQTYILNTNTKKFHRPACSTIGTMKESNKEIRTGSRDAIIGEGYEPCKRCNP